MSGFGVSTFNTSDIEINNGVLTGVLVYAEGIYDFKYKIIGK